MMKSRHSHSRVGSRKQPPNSSRTLILTLLVTFTLLVLFLLALGILSFPTVSSSLPNHLNSIARNEAEDEKKQWVEVISWQPRAFLYHNFLTKEECEYLINIAKPNMQKSTVVNSKTGQNVDSRVRTSSGTFLARGRDKIVSNIEKRIADFTFVPVEHGEDLQVLHYEVGQKYDPHPDYFSNEYLSWNGGERIVTMLMYLSDVEEGGETVFPYAAENFSSVPWWNLSDCAKKGVAIKPKMGDALLFWSMKPDASIDPRSVHGGCPVIKGDKWSSTKWMRLREYRSQIPK